jgi:uncharacterized RDD family membrane protein YckC
VKRSYAGLWVRLSAFALDYIIMAGYLLLITALGSLLNVFFPAVVLRVFSNPLTGQLAGFGLLTVPISSYFVLLEASAWQATWGKRRKSLRVIRADGARLSGLRATGRTALKFIPWELAHTCIWQIRFASPAASPLITAGFVLVWILIGSNALSLVISPTHQTLYDWLSGTLVVTE